MNDKIQNCYRTLDLENGASLEEVKQARRDLAKVWHPDRFPNDPKMQRKANEKLKDINHAYEELETLLAVAEPPPTPRQANPKKYPPRHTTTPPPQAHSKSRNENTKEKPETPPKQKSPRKNKIANYIYLVLFLIVVVGAASSLHSFLHREKPHSQQAQTAQVESIQNPPALTTKELQVKAEMGDAEAQYKLGKCYYNGNEVTKDDVEAVKWWRKAAAQNNADAECNLGVSYKYGEGVIKDEVEALKWYRKAAAQNECHAECNLGIAYDLGQGVAQDQVEAVRWYRKSADQNFAEAQYNLGIHYRDGQGVAQDFVEAEKWLRKSAEQNNADAKSALADLLRQYEWNKTEIDVPKNGNGAVAVYWLMRDPAIRESASTPPLELLAKNPLDYLGKVVKLTGKVVDVRDYPAGSEMAVGGKETSVIMIQCIDQTLASSFCMKSSGNMKVGDSVNLFGYPVGKIQEELVLFGNDYDILK
jgi:TPR repeat protein